MEQNNSKGVPSLRGTWIHRKSTQELYGISFALSGMMLAWVIGMVLAVFLPAHSGLAMLALVILAGLADVLVMRILGNRLRELTAGISGAKEPNWDARTTSDGTVTWTNASKLEKDRQKRPH